MKKLIFLMPAMIISSLLSFAPFEAFCSARAPKNHASFETSPAFEKLDLRSREAWRQAIATGTPGTKLECFLKTSRPATADDKAILAAAGFKARTFIGVILTGEVSASALPAVAELDFVTAMELSTPLSLKKSE